MQNDERKKKIMSILFINGSPNKNGNTVGLAKELLAGKEIGRASCRERVSGIV